MHLEKGRIKETNFIIKGFRFIGCSKYLTFKPIMLHWNIKLGADLVLLLCLCFPLNISLLIWMMRSFDILQILSLWVVCPCSLMVAFSMSSSFYVICFIFIPAKCLFKLWSTLSIYGLILTMIYCDKLFLVL